ncbi:PEROXIDASE 61-RELATED [Salix purpurea]|uniref:Peroxidase n=1 Tax=Salix purpurea TaxID=77065 RepID=A0A9Q0V3Y4_SALPP|nr:PEROXIDASE 61-RELATED [Salix purpurea]
MRRGQKRVFFPLLAIALCLCIANVDAGTTLQPPVKLKWHHYRRDTTCKYAEEFVRHQVELFWKEDRSITAKLLRLLYSDCFVTGCDASILLDGPDSEKTAPQNWGLGGFVAIDKIKKVLEIRCPGVVSCADILNLATRDAVHLAGGPAYPVFTGRRDGVISKAAMVDLPSPSISGGDALAYFKSRGLDVLDLGTLLGAHSMGRTHCRYILDRLYNFNNTGKPDPSMNKAFADQMRKQCPQRTKKGQSDPLVFLNPESSSKYTFTESFYKRVLSYQSVLGVDQQLLFSNDTLQITEEFAGGFEYLRRSFALSMSRMGNINVLTGNAGEIRQNCRYINNGKPQ